MFDDDTYESDSSQSTLLGNPSKSHTETTRQKQTPKKTQKSPVQQIDKKNFKTKKGEGQKKFKTIVKKKIATVQENKPEKPKAKKKGLNTKQNAVKAFTQEVLEALFEFNQGKW